MIHGNGYTLTSTLMLVGDLLVLDIIRKTGTNGDAPSLFTSTVLLKPTQHQQPTLTVILSKPSRKVKPILLDGSSNASTSVRLATTRSGGELIDITDYCKKIDVIGLGMAPTDVNSIDLVDGTKRYQRTNLTSRYFTIAVAFNDTTIGGVQASRNAMIELIKPDLVPDQQPMIIRLSGRNRCRCSSERAC